MGNNTLVRMRNVIDNVRQQCIFSLNVHFEGDKMSLKGPYDQKNLTVMVISYEIYETRRRLIYKFHMKLENVFVKHHAANHMPDPKGKCSL